MTFFTKITHVIGELRAGLCGKVRLKFSKSAERVLNKKWHGSIFKIKRQTKTPYTILLNKVVIHIKTFHTKLLCGTWSKQSSDVKHFHNDSSLGQKMPMYQISSNYDLQVERKTTRRSDGRKSFNWFWKDGVISSPFGLAYIRTNLTASGVGYKTSD